MSRGLTEEPTPEETGPASSEEMHEAIQELFSMTSFLFAKMDAIEKIIGHSLDLPEAEAADKKRFKGL